MNPNVYVEGFFSWVDIDVSGISWPIGEGGGVLNILFKNYTLTSSSVWVINGQGKVLINSYDEHNNLIDVHDIRADFDQRYIKEANLTRLSAGRYSIIFNINNKIGRTDIIFNVDGKEQTLRVDIKKYPRDAFTFLKENLWLLFIVFLLFVITIFIFVITLLRNRDNAEEEVNA